MGQDVASLRSILIRNRTAIAPVIGLFGVYWLFLLIGPDSFSSGRNLETIARQTTIVGIAAIGMTLVIISGGIDLSAGSIIALSTVVVAATLNTGVSPFISVLSGVVSGILAGLVNGLIVSRLKVVPFIVTLGTLLIVRGIAKGIANEQKIDTSLTWLIDLLAALPPGARWMIFPPGVWLLLILAGLAAGFLSATPTGKHIVAVGSNEATARVCGIRVERIKTAVYVISGGMAGLAGVMQFSRLTVGDPTVAVGLELDVIAAVVIGGGSLSGGEGSILGTIVGALIMTVIRSGCSQMGLPNWVQEIVTGSIIVLAVAVDRYRHR